MKAVHVTEVMATAKSLLPKATVVDVESPVAFFAVHLNEISKLIRGNPAAGSCLYMLQFTPQMVEDEWPALLSTTLEGCGYSVILTVSPWGHASYTIRWQAIEPAV